MSAAPAVGVVFPPWFPPERLRPTALAAEAAGADELWVWEDSFLESGIASAAAALGWTERLKVRIGLTPAPFRNVALLAMEIATLDRLFPGRFRCVVGHGVQSWMGQAGVRARSPLQLLEEYVVVLNRLLAGEEVTVAGDYVRLDGVKLAWPPLGSCSVLAGATGRRSLALIGDMAPGVLVDSGNSPRMLVDVLDVVRSGAVAAGRRDAPEVAVYVHTAFGPEAAQRLRAHVGDPDVDGHPRGLAGSVEEVVAGVRQYAAAGAGTVVLRPLEDDPDIEGFAAIAGEVADAVAAQR